MYRASTVFPAPKSTSAPNDQTDQTTSSTSPSDSNPRGPRDLLMNRVGCVTSRVSPSTPFGGPTEPDPIAREGGVFGRLQGVARAQQQAGAINRMLAISGCPERLEFSRNPNADTLPRNQVPVLPKRQESQEYIEDETQRAKFYDETVIEVFRTLDRLERRTGAAFALFAAESVFFAPTSSTALRWLT